MSATKPGVRPESVLPEDLRPQSFRLAMGLQELSRTSLYRSLSPIVKRILTSYLGGGMPEDVGNWESSVARYRVGWDKEKIVADAERIMQEPLVKAVLRIQRGEIQK